MCSKLAAVSISFLFAGTALSAGASRPTLALVGKTAVQLEGRNFPPRRAVRVVFTSGTRRERLVRSDAAGSFDTPLPPRDTCDALTITASVPGGVTVMLKLPRPQRGCITASSPR